MLFQSKLRLIDWIRDSLGVPASCTFDNSSPFFFEQLSAVSVCLLFLFHDHITLECLAVCAAKMFKALLNTKTPFSLFINFIGLLVWGDLSTSIIKIFKYFCKIFLVRSLILWNIQICSGAKLHISTVVLIQLMTKLMTIIRFSQQYLLQLIWSRRGTTSLFVYFHVLIHIYVSVSLFLFD